MKEPIIVTLPELLDDEGFEQLIIKCGAEYNAVAVPHEGRLTVGNNHVWVFNDEPGLVIEPSDGDGLNPAMLKFLQKLLEVTQATIMGTDLEGLDSEYGKNKESLQTWLETLT